MDREKPLLNKAYTVGTPDAEAVRDVARQLRRDRPLADRNAEVLRAAHLRHIRRMSRPTPVEPMS